MTACRTPRLRFNVLGPLEGWADDTRLRLGGTIQERVFAALLLETGRVLPVSRLVTIGWGMDPPSTASHQVRKAVADLRRRIPGGADVLLTDGPGYRSVVSDGQLDLVEFAQRVAAAKTAVARGSLAEAAESLRGGLALWRGQVLSGEGGPVIDAAATTLEERYLAAAEKLFEIRLELGEAAELIPDLRELVRRHPLRETLRGHLMLALYRGGRQAEALEEYGRFREELVEELGIDPGPQLSGIHEGILREDPVLAGPVAHAAPAPPPRLSETSGAPCTLPYEITDFTGRERELRDILERARRTNGRGTRIVALDGMGGCGKTSLAVRAAHRLAPEYPDGQLHIDLRGYAPGEEPVTTAPALDHLLRALGIPTEHIPEDPDGRVALWRTSLAGKRLLLLLDNAADARDLLPLLPTSTDTLVLITSRTRLLDLDGADWISIDVLTPEESAALIVETLGAERVEAEPEAAAELALLCGHLPLAIRIATARLRNRSRWTLRYLTDRLRDEDRRLDELSSGERGVAATLRLSYQVLDEHQRGTFRTLALHPGHDFEVHAAAALLGTDPRDAEDLLEFLLDTHLLQQPEIGRYMFHDLVRSFAQSLRDHTTRAMNALAVERLLDHYLAVTEQACRFIFPGRTERPTGLKPSPARQPALGDTDGARLWFAREYATLMSTLVLAERNGLDRHSVWLSRNLVFHLNARGRTEEFAELSRRAVTAARRTNDPILLSVSLANLGAACWKLGRYAEGIEVAEEARSIAESLGDHVTEAHSDRSIGSYKSLLGRFDEALPHLERALAHEREGGSTHAEVETLTVLSTLYEQWGRHREAAEAARRAVELVRRLGGDETELVALTDLAFAHIGLRRYTDADVCLREARALCDDGKDPGHAAMALALSADIARRLDRSREAAEYAEQALSLVETSTSPVRRAKVTNMLGRFRHSRGAHREAGGLHEHALEIASSVGFRTEEAYAHTGLARAVGALGDTRTAEEHRKVAEEMFTAMGVPADRRRD